MLESEELKDPPKKGHSIQKGEQLWKLRKDNFRNGGRKKIFQTPQKLLHACLVYMQWVIDNPLTEEKLFCSNGEVISGTLNKMRPMTIEGLCVHTGICRRTWYTYKERDEPEDDINQGLTFHQVIEYVDNAMFEYNFSGAAADLLNTAIIGRKLGLKEITTTEIDAIGDFGDALKNALRNNTD